MWNRRAMIASATVLMCFICINCATVVKKNEASIEITEESKPDMIASPAPEPEKPSALEPSMLAPTFIPTEIMSISESLTPPRRLVTYDQRQEGKYNIRADLENFMIVLVPTSQSGSSGSSLLDLLSRNSQQKSKAGTNKNHKKYHKQTKINEKSNVQADEAILNKLGSLQQSALIKQQMAAALAAEQSRRNQPFIEGRTPYHVDISSSELSDNQQPQQRPYIYARLLRSLNPSNRQTKSLSEAFGPRSDLSTNSVVLVQPMHERFFQHRRSFDNTDYSDSSNSYSGAEEERFDDGQVLDSIDRLAAAGQTPKSGNDGWDELSLLGAQEQCGPDRRRDSYGVCQFVQL